MKNVLIISEWNLVNNWIRTIVKGFQKGKTIFNPLHSWVTTMVAGHLETGQECSRLPDAVDCLCQPSSHLPGPLLTAWVVCHTWKGPHGADEEYYLVLNSLHSEQWLGAQDQQRGAVLENWESWLRYRD